MCCLLEWKDAVGDQDRRPPYDMNVADINGDHLESPLPLQQRRQVPGPRAEIQNGALVRQPVSHLRQHLAGSPFHDGVEDRLQHFASSKAAEVLGAYPRSRSSRVSRRIFFQ